MAKKKTPIKIRSLIGCNDYTGEWVIELEVEGGNKLKSIVDKYWATIDISKVSLEGVPYYVRGVTDAIVSRVKGELAIHGYKTKVDMNNIEDFLRSDIRKEIAECKAAYQRFLKSEEEEASFLPECDDKEIEECLSNETCRYEMENAREIHEETGMYVGC